MTIERLKIATECEVAPGRPLARLREIDWVVRVRSVWDRRGSSDADAAAKTVNYLVRYANRAAIVGCAKLAWRT